MLWIFCRNYWGCNSPTFCTGTQYQLFNVGLRLSRLFCPNVTHLNISGCGLVSNQLLELLEEEEENADRAAKRPKLAFNQGQAPKTCLKSLIMLTYYEDTDQVDICHLWQKKSYPTFYQSYMTSINLGSDLWGETSTGNHTEQPRSRMYKFRSVISENKTQDKKIQ